jgi:hypothetical protein
MSTDTSSTRSASQLTEYRHDYDVILRQSYSTCTQSATYIQGELRAEAWSDDNSTGTYTSVTLRESSSPSEWSKASGGAFYMDSIFESRHLPKITFGNEESLEQAKCAFILGKTSQPRLSLTEWI